MKVFTLEEIRGRTVKVKKSHFLQGEVFVKMVSFSKLTQEEIALVRWENKPTVTKSTFGTVSGEYEEATSTITLPAGGIHRAGWQSTLFHEYAHHITSIFVQYNAFNWYWESINDEFETFFEVFSKKWPGYYAATKSQELVAELFRVGWGFKSEARWKEEWEDDPLVQEGLALLKGNGFETLLP